MIVHRRLCTPNYYFPSIKSSQTCCYCGFLWINVMRTHERVTGPNRLKVPLKKSDHINFTDWDTVACYIYNWNGYRYSLCVYYSASSSLHFDRCSSNVACPPTFTDTGSSASLIDFTCRRTVMSLITRWGDYRLNINVFTISKQDLPEIFFSLHPIPRSFILQ